MIYEITKGDRYRHYKGGIYKIQCMATHTEDMEALVVYTDEGGRWWGRPVEMFFGYATNEAGYAVKRFELIEEESE